MPGELPPPFKLGGLILDDYSHVPHAASKTRLAVLVEAEILESGLSDYDPCHYSLLGSCGGTVGWSGSPIPGVKVREMEPGFLMFGGFGKVAARRCRIASPVRIYS